MRHLAVIAICSAVLLNGCSEPPKQREMPPAAVEVLTLQKAPLKRSTQFVSRTTAINDVTIRSQVTESLVSQHFTTGDDVKTGDLLYTLEKTPFENQVAQRKASLTRAESALETAERNYKRGLQLEPAGNISQADMDTLTNNFNTAKASVAEAKAALDDAELKLNYTEIKAPIDGRMGISDPSIGDVINANTDVLTTIVSLDPMRVIFQLDEKALASRVHQDMSGSPVDNVNKDYRFDLVMPNGQTYQEEGRLVYMDNRVSANTGTISLRADFPNPSLFLLPGQYVTLVVSKREPETVLMIPQSAVQQTQGGYSVLVAGENNIAQSVSVKLGDRFEASWEVVSGLNEGDRVIVNGIQKVRVGGPVQPTEQQHRPFDEQGKAVTPSAEKE